MKKVLLAIGVVIIAAVGYLGGTYVKNSYFSNANLITQVKEVKESSDNYEISARYPQFGEAVFDTHIKKVVDESISEIKKYAEPARSESGYKNSFMSDYSDPYIGQDVLSVKLILTQYTGGAHPITHISALSYDRKSGKVMELQDALALIGMTTEQLSSEATRQLKAKLGDPLQFPEGANSNPENFSSFAVSDDKVTFIFQEYQVAAYAAGIQEVSIERKK